MTLRVGVMGGMFDPPHIGHKDVALAALELLQLDQLRMVPCGIPNHRAHAHCTPAQRLEMLHLATQDDSRISIDPQEINRSGVSYSIDTLESIKAETSPSDLFFILGVDAFDSLPQWHRWQELFELCNFVVFARPGTEVNPQSIIGLEFTNRQVNSIEELLQSRVGKIIILREFDIQISSSLVKERLANNQSVEELLNPEVAEYLTGHKLYH